MTEFTKRNIALFKREQVEREFEERTPEEEIQFLKNKIFQLEMKMLHEASEIKSCLEEKTDKKWHRGYVIERCEKVIENVFYTWDTRQELKNKTK